MFKSKYFTYGIFILGIIAIIFIGGCVQQGPKCPQCPDPNSWSKCNDQAIKTRTNYKCSAETNYACQSYEETANCKTEMILKGNKGLDVMVSPTLDETVVNNGVYNLGIMTTVNPSGGPWTDVVQTQVIVEN